MPIPDHAEQALEYIARHAELPADGGALGRVARAIVGELAPEILVFTAQQSAVLAWRARFVVGLTGVIQSVSHGGLLFLDTCRHLTR
jgi:hypothetical protein